MKNWNLRILKKNMKSNKSIEKRTTLKYFNKNPWTYSH